MAYNEMKEFIQAPERKPLPRDTLGVFVALNLTGVKVGNEPCSVLIWASLMIL